MDLYIKHLSDEKLTEEYRRLNALAAEYKERADSAMVELNRRYHEMHKDI